ncbi:hypothetical protein Tco_0062462 [Tanacetum coccineum]
MLNHALFDGSYNETSNDSEVDDNFPGETLMEINTKDEPWFADFANYLVGNIIPKGMAYQQKNKFYSDLKHYFWEEPYLFKVDIMDGTDIQKESQKRPNQARDGKDKAKSKQSQAKSESQPRQSQKSTK